MSKNKLEQMCRDHFNEPVIAGFDIVRCVGYAEDEMDCYLILRRPGWEDTPDDYWHTCVGGYTFLDRLKGQEYIKSTGGEDWDDFTRLDNLLRINNAPKAETFILKLERPASDESTP